MKPAVVKDNPYSDSVKVRSNKEVNDKDCKI